MELDHLLQINFVLWLGFQRKGSTNRGDSYKERYIIGAKEKQLKSQRIIFNKATIYIFKFVDHVDHLKPPKLILQLFLCNFISFRAHLHFKKDILVIKSSKTHLNSKGNTSSKALWVKRKARAMKTHFRLNSRMLNSNSKETAAFQYSSYA